MAVLIGGHQRSGTTMLKNLFNVHPQVFITGEFGNFMHLDMPFDQYARYIWSVWWRKRNSAILERHPVKGVNMLRNMMFCARYLTEMGRRRPKVVDAAVITETLLNIMPGKTLVGDKHPDYVFVMDRFVKNEDLKLITIYRDPRDVASSSFKRAREELLNHWPDELRDPRGVAERWLYAVKKIEEHGGDMFAIQYENFVMDPSHVVDRLSDWLGVDRSGFDLTMIRPTSVGKHRKHLTEQEINQVLEVAGATMQRLGYEV